MAIQMNLELLDAAMRNDGADTGQGNHQDSYRGNLEVNQIVFGVENPGE